jgi:hypothetical protein
MSLVYIYLPSSIRVHEVSRIATRLVSPTETQVPRPDPNVLCSAPEPTISSRWSERHRKQHLLMSVCMGNQRCCITPPPAPFYPKTPLRVIKSEAWKAACERPGLHHLCRCIAPEHTVLARRRKSVEDGLRIVPSSLQLYYTMYLKTPHQLEDVDFGARFQSRGLE